MSKDYTIEVLEMAVKGKLPKNINMRKDREYRHLLDTIDELIHDKFLEGRGGERTLSFSEQEEMEKRGERPPEYDWVISGLRITQSGRTHLEELKTRTIRARFCKWIWRVACFLGGAVTLKVIEELF